VLKTCGGDYAGICFVIDLQAHVLELNNLDLGLNLVWMALRDI